MTAPIPGAAAARQIARWDEEGRTERAAGAREALYAELVAHGLDPHVASSQVASLVRKASKAVQR